MFTYKNHAHEFYDKVTSIFTSAIILFAALAWRDCAIVYVDKNPHIQNSGSWIYAGIVSIIAIIVIVLLMYPFRHFACGKQEY